MCTRACVHDRGKERVRGGREERDDREGRDGSGKECRREGGREREREREGGREREREMYAFHTSRHSVQNPT